jgi:drug/metabolite transporter (DMT)-like permease
VPARLRPYFPELALALASALYGSTFLLVQDALDDVSPSAFNVLRFGVAAIALVPLVARRDWRGPDPRPTDSVRTLVVAGFGLGLVGIVAYQTQNVGLHHTSTSNSSFITGLFVVFTPVIAAFRYRRPPRPRVVGAVACALIGLFLLTGATLHLSFGDGVTLITAFAWAVWLIGTGEVTRRYDTFALIFVQVITIGIGSAVFAAFEGFGALTGAVVLAVVVTGVGCSAIAFSLSAWAQRIIDPERAGVINLLEPVVAGVIGYVAGERLGVSGYVGAALILASILVVERHTHDHTKSTAESRAGSGERPEAAVAIARPRARSEAEGEPRRSERASADVSERERSR